MRIVCLIENSPGEPGCRLEHGLSVYLETERHRILADTGASDAFLHNAALAGVDLGAVDLLFLSHGHYDHAGGIPAFAAAYPGAEIYMQRTAGLDYYGLDPEGERYIGIDKSILELPRLHLLEGSMEVDEEVSILSGITGRRCWSKSNLRLMRRENGRMVQDSFDHEQALVVRQNGKYLLFSGCAHNGILNVLDRFRAVYGRDPDLVISWGRWTRRSTPVTAPASQPMRSWKRSWGRSSIRCTVEWRSPACNAKKPPGRAAFLCGIKGQFRHQIPDGDLRQDPQTDGGDHIHRRVLLDEHGGQGDHHCGGGDEDLEGRGGAAVSQPGGGDAHGVGHVQRGTDPRGRVKGIDEGQHPGEEVFPGPGGRPPAGDPAGWARGCTPPWPRPA